MNTGNPLVHAGEAGRWGGWSWRKPRRGDFFRTCNYCGSIHPDDLAEATGWRASWADHKYGWPHKFYVEELANPNPELLYTIVGGSGEPPPDNATYHYVRVADLTPEERQRTVDDGMSYSGSREDGYVGFGRRKTLFAKCYSVHLADPDISEATRQAVGLRCGLRFEYVPDGRIAWRAAV